MAFCDLNIVRSSKERDKQAIVLRLIELGWSCLAWNCISSGKFNQIIPVPGVVIEPRYLSQTNQRRLISGVTNTPIESTSISGSSTLKTTVNSKSTNNSFHQYSRVTIPIDDMTEAQRLNASNPVLNQFDIVAVVPGNYKVFSYCCRTADVDLISIDFAHRVPYVLDKKLLDEAVKRGISFEIQYAPLLLGQAVRKEVLSNTRLLVQYLRGKNIVLSSGADVCNNIRGPMDAANIGQILGIKKEQALRCNRENCEALLNHGRCRKQRFSVVEMLPATELKDLVAGRDQNKSQNQNQNQDEGRDRKRSRADASDNEVQEVGAAYKRDRVAAVTTCETTSLSNVRLDSQDDDDASRNDSVEDSDSDSDSDHEAEQQQQLMMLNRKKSVAAAVAASKNAVAKSSVSSAGLEDESEDDGFLKFK